MVFFEGAVTRSELYEMPLSELFELLEDAENIAKIKERAIKNGAK